MPSPVVILASALATRMRPVTGTMPNALLPVDGRPVADLQLVWRRGPCCRAQPWSPTPMKRSPVPMRVGMLTEPLGYRDLEWGWVMG